MQDVPDEPYLLVPCSLRRNQTTPGIEHIPLPSETPTVTMPVLPIYVAQYYVGHSSRGVLPYGWHIIVHTGFDKKGEPVGNAYFVTGCTAKGWAFQYFRNVAYRSGSKYRGCARVGAVERTQLEELERQLARAEIVNREPSWNYQSWAGGALRRLHAQGFDIDDLVWKRMGAVMRAAEDAYNMEY